MTSSKRSFVFILPSGCVLPHLELKGVLASDAIPITRSRHLSHNQLKGPTSKLWNSSIDGVKSTDYFRGLFLVSHRILQRPSTPIIRKPLTVRVLGTS